MANLTAEELERLTQANSRLAAVVTDMLAGLAYLRTTDRVPYGFGIERLEHAGREALRLNGPTETGR